MTRKLLAIFAVFFFAAACTPQVQRADLAVSVTADGLTSQIDWK